MQDNRLFTILCKKFRRKLPDEVVSRGFQRNKNAKNIELKRRNDVDLLFVLHFSVLLNCFTWNFQYNFLIIKLDTLKKLVVQDWVLFEAAAASQHLNLYWLYSNATEFFLFFQIDYFLDLTSYFWWP
jgi:hypothetical protein